MDHLDISNTVDSTGAFGLARIATTDLSTSSAFFNLVGAKATQNTG